MMTSNRIEYLFKRMREKKCTDEEVAELNDWFHSLKGGRPDFENWIVEAGGEQQLTESLLDRFNSKIISRGRYRRKMVWYRLAAILFITLTAGALLIKTQYTGFVGQQIMAKKMVMPGTNKAVLTLADGSKIEIDSSAKGNLAKQAGGVTIRKTASGKLTYVHNGRSDESAIAYNTIATPRAGQFEVELPDGTRVWLNSVTKLRYPVQFKGNERKVELTGEAYFEVAHNKTMPFIVATGDQTVTVLGTHFNIKAYEDEGNITTTLLEGKVSVANRISSESKILIPGTQANVAKLNGTIGISNANIDQIMAWKNGYFIFENQDIKSIMKLISRWYDVDVDFKLTKSVRFGGTFSRSSDLNKLLKNFELLGDLHFQIKERRVTVSN